MLSEPLLVVARLARTFEDLAIRYAVGGSLASSLYGFPCATQDVDLVAEIELLLTSLPLQARLPVSSMSMPA